MSNIPSRMSSPELNLNHAPSAINGGDAASSASSAPSAPSGSRPYRRRSSFSFGRLFGILILLAAVAAGLLWIGHGVGRSGGKKPVGAAGKSEPWIDLSQVDEGMRPVVEYLHPSPDEASLWFEAIRSSTYVRQKWASLADAVAFQYAPGDNTVNAGACFLGKNPNRPAILMCGGIVRLARLIGAVALVEASAEAQGVEKDPKAYLKRVSEAGFNDEGLSDDQVVNLLNEFEVGVAVFQNTAAVSAAKTMANGICKAVLAHEMGHLVGGHPLGADPNKTVSKNEEAQADLFAGSVAASVENGQQMRLGQILQWYVFALGEVQNPKNEMFRTHPYSADRLRAAVQANKTLAASMGITPEVVDKLTSEAAQVAVATAGEGDASAEPEAAAEAEAPAASKSSLETKAASGSEQADGADEAKSDAGETPDAAATAAPSPVPVEKVEDASLLATMSVLSAAKKGDGETLVTDAPAFEIVDSPEEPKMKALVETGGLYTEIGAMTRISLAPNPQFQSCLRLSRVSFFNGGLTISTEGKGAISGALAGTVRIGGHLYEVYENSTAAQRFFIADNGEILSVVNMAMAMAVIFYDKGDTRRQRRAYGLRTGVAFPNVDAVVQWSLSQRISIDPGALSSVNFGGGASGRGAANCPTCHGTGYVRKLAGASYGQSHGDNWVVVPCPNPSCRAGR